MGLLSIFSFARKSSTANGSGKESAAARSVMVVAMDSSGLAHLCTVRVTDSTVSEPRQTTLMLDGSATASLIRKSLRELEWRGQRGDLCFVVVPSEEVLIRIEEFPTTDPKEAQAMAEGVLQGMVELDPADHILSTRILSTGGSQTICALAVFHRQRIEKLFGTFQRLGIADPQFVVDVFGEWVASGERIRTGCWGTWRRDEKSSRVAVKVLQVVDGVIRGLRQRLYFREQSDPEWFASLETEFLPEERQENGTAAPIITWQQPAEGAASSGRLLAYVNLAAQGRIAHFQLQPGFWREHLKRQRVRRGVTTSTALAAVCYLLFLVYLTGASAWQWYQGGKLQRTRDAQETEYRKAVDLKDELDALEAHEIPSRNVLEVLLQIVEESMPREFVLTDFTYEYQLKRQASKSSTVGKGRTPLSTSGRSGGSLEKLSKRVLIKGTAPDARSVLDFKTKLGQNSLFLDVQDEPISSAEGQGKGVRWAFTLILA